MLDFTGRQAGRQWEEVAGNMGVPLVVRDIDHEGAKRLYDADLVLVRPDMMVAWRGAAGVNARDILTTVTGRAMQPLAA